MHLLEAPMGKKIVMAVTGVLMIAFATVHLAGNLTVFGGDTVGMNAYAHQLHSMPWPVIAVFRVVVLTLLVLHVSFGISLAIGNNAARKKYAVTVARKAVFAGESMIWTGLLLLAFIGFHLLHFTLHSVSPAPSASLNAVAGIPDVAGMVMAAFKNLAIVSVYVAAMIVLLLHLSHGIQSCFQTVGWNNGRTIGYAVKVGSMTALVIFLGYVSIPLTIFSKILE